MQACRCLSSQPAPDRYVKFLMLIVSEQPSGLYCPDRFVNDKKRDLFAEAPQLVMLYDIPGFSGRLPHRVRQSVVYDFREVFIVRDTLQIVADPEI